MQIGTSNSTLQNASSSVYATLEEATRIKQIGLSILLVLFCAICAGNFSVVFALLRRNKLNQMQLFIVNLAFTDLFVAISGVLPEIIWNVTVQFYAPNPICKLVKFMSSAITYASSFALVVLSVDRAEAVCRPLRVASRGISSSGWITAGLCGLPGMILAHKYNEGTDRENCFFDFTNISPQVYLTCIAISVFLIPACLIAACHVIMVATIWRASKLQATTFDANHSASEPLDVSSNTTAAVSANSAHTSIEKQPRLIIPRYTRHKRSSDEGFLQKPMQSTHQNAGCIPRAKVKTVKMTCLIVSAYIICWCPFMMWNLLVTYGVIRRAAPHLMKYSPIIQHLVPLNSATNPIIFWIFNAGSIRKRKARPTGGPSSARVIIPAHHM